MKFYHLLLVFLLVGPVTAQNLPPSLPEPIAEGEMDMTVYWLPGTHILVWEYGSKRYDADTGELTINPLPDHLNLSIAVLTSPLTIKLTETEQQAFGSAFSQVFISSDARYLVFYQETNCWDSYQGISIRCYQDLLLGDRLTGEAEPLGLDKMGLGYDFGYNIRWSEDSSAVMVEASGWDFTQLYHVSHYRDDFSQLQLHPLWSVYAWSAYADLAPDGQRVLLDADNLNSQYDKSLVLWNAQTIGANPPVQGHGGILNPAAQASQLIRESGVVGAAFIPGDADHILMIDEQGFVKYDLQTGKTVVLNADINASWIKRAVFSPDKCYVAVFSNTEAYSAPCCADRLHVLRVADLITPNSKSE